MADETKATSPHDYRDKSSPACLSAGLSHPHIKCTPIDTSTPPHKDVYVPHAGSVHHDSALGTPPLSPFSLTPANVDIPTTPSALSQSGSPDNTLTLLSLHPAPDGGLLARESLQEVSLGSAYDADSSAPSTSPDSPASTASDFSPCNATSTRHTLLIRSLPHSTRRLPRKAHNTADADASVLSDGLDSDSEDSVGDAQGVMGTCRVRVRKADDPRSVWVRAEVCAFTHSAAEEDVVDWQTKRAQYAFDNAVSMDNITISACAAVLSQHATTSNHTKADIAATPSQNKTLTGVAAGKSHGPQEVCAESVAGQQSLSVAADTPTQAPGETRAEAERVESETNGVIDVEEEEEAPVIEVCPWRGLVAEGDIMYAPPPWKDPVGLHAFWAVEDDEDDEPEMDWKQWLEQMQILKDGVGDDGKGDNDDNNDDSSFDIAVDAHAASSASSDVPVQSGHLTDPSASVQASRDTAVAAMIGAGIPTVERLRIRGDGCRNARKSALKRAQQRYKRRGRRGSEHSTEEADVEVEDYDNTSDENLCDLLWPLGNTMPATNCSADDNDLCCNTMTSLGRNVQPACNVTEQEYVRWACYNAFVQSLPMEQLLPVSLECRDATPGPAEEEDVWSVCEGGWWRWRDGLRQCVESTGGSEREWAEAVREWTETSRKEAYRSSSAWARLSALATCLTAACLRRCGVQDEMDTRPGPRGEWDWEGAWGVPRLCELLAHGMGVRDLTPADTRGNCTCVSERLCRACLPRWMACVRNAYANGKWDVHKLWVLGGVYDDWVQEQRTEAARTKAEKARSHGGAMANTSAKDEDASAIKGGMEDSEPKADVSPKSRRDSLAAPTSRQRLAQRRCSRPPPLANSPGVSPTDALTLPHSPALSATSSESSSFDSLLRSCTPLPLRLPLWSPLDARLLLPTASGISPDDLAHEDTALLAAPSRSRYARAADVPSPVSEEATDMGNVADAEAWAEKWGSTPVASGGDSGWEPVGLTLSPTLSSPLTAESMPSLSPYVSESNDSGGECSEGCVRTHGFKGRNEPAYEWCCGESRPEGPTPAVSEEEEDDECWTDRAATCGGETPENCGMQECKSAEERGERRIYGPQLPAVGWVAGVRQGCLDVEAHTTTYTFSPPQSHTPVMSPSLVRIAHMNTCGSNGAADSYPEPHGRRADTQGCLVAAHVLESVLSPPVRASTPTHPSDCDGDERRCDMQVPPDGHEHSIMLSSSAAQALATRAHAHTLLARSPTALLQVLVDTDRGAQRRHSRPDTEGEKRESSASSITSAASTISATTKSCPRTEEATLLRGDSRNGRVDQAGISLENVKADAAAHQRSPLPSPARSDSHPHSLAAMEDVAARTPLPHVCPSPARSPSPSPANWLLDSLYGYPQSSPSPHDNVAQAHVDERSPGQGIVAERGAEGDVRGRQPRSREFLAAEEELMHIAALAGASDEDMTAFMSGWERAWDEEGPLGRPGADTPRQNGQWVWWSDDDAGGESESRHQSRPSAARMRNARERLAAQRVVDAHIARSRNGLERGRRALAPAPVQAGPETVGAALKRIVLRCIGELGTCTRRRPRRDSRASENRRSRDSVPHAAAIPAHAPVGQPPEHREPHSPLREPHDHASNGAILANMAMRVGGALAEAITWGYFFIVSLVTCRANRGAHDKDLDDERPGLAVPATVTEGHRVRHPRSAAVADGHHIPLSPLAVANAQGASVQPSVRRHSEVASSRTDVGLSAALQRVWRHVQTRALSGTGKVWSVISRCIIALAWVVLLLVERTWTLLRNGLLAIGLAWKALFTHCTRGWRHEAAARPRAHLGLGEGWLSDREEGEWSDDDAEGEEVEVELEERLGLDADDLQDFAAIRTISGFAQWWQRQGIMSNPNNPRPYHIYGGAAARAVSAWAALETLWAAEQAGVMVDEGEWESVRMQAAEEQRAACGCVRVLGAAGAAKLKAQGWEECGVCWSEMEKNDTVLVMHCSHVFHFACAWEWLRTKARCPHCRAHTGEESAREAWPRAVERLWGEETRQSDVNVHTASAQ